MPQHGDTLSIDGLDGEVDILRDEWGIPHVRASTALDAFRGQGFVQAQDRLGQLEADRRRAYGRWAEVAGAGAVPFDVFARRCDLRGVARREFEALDDETRRVLEAFADGVNAYRALGAPLPLDLELAGITPDPWEPWDSCAVFLVRHIVMGSWQKKLWRGRLIVALGPELVARLEGADPATTPLIVPPGAPWHHPETRPDELTEVALASRAAVDAAQGSNGWALSGAHTASGSPFLAGDPHRTVEAPGVYYQCHLVSPEFDAAGLAFVGVPGIPHFGQTGRTAWCVTNANADYQDLYVERFRSGDRLEYDAGNEWIEAAQRLETVLVHDAEPVVVECVETRHGPIVFGEPASGHAIALRAPSLCTTSRGLSVVLPMLRARTVAELDAVMEHWVDPVNNFVSADVDGNIAYRTVGEVPVRSAANTWGPVPGWDDAHEWTGMIPYAELPTLRNPDTGRIVTANQRIVGDDYPHDLGMDVAPPFRAARILARLEVLPTGLATVSDMAAVQRDRRSVAADAWIDRLVRLDGVDEWERAALELVREWDRNVDTDSAGAAVYMVIRDAVGHLVVHDARLDTLRDPFDGEPRSTFRSLEGRLWPLLNSLLANDDTALLPDGRSWDDVLAAALTDGVGVLRTTLGDDIEEWRWGALHVLALEHPLSGIHPEWEGRLDPPAVEVGGEFDTVRMAAHAAGAGFGVTASSVARYVFDLGDRSQSAWVVPLGVAGDPTDIHFYDQQAPWVAGELLPIRTDWPTLLDTAETIIHLQPES
jgi:penicillin G amidase